MRVGMGDEAEQAGERPMRASFQHRQHRDDADEDAGEELGDLLDRPPAKLVAGADWAGRQLEREAASQ